MDKYHERLVSLRKERGFSQEAMAFEMGIQRSTYGKFERGETGLFSPNLEKYLKATGLKVEDIFEGGQQVLDGILYSRDAEERIDELCEEINGLKEKIEELTAVVLELCKRENKND